MASFPGYSIASDEPLGKGGFATVFLATSDETQEPVAIKQFTSENGQAVDEEKAQNELAVLRALGDHANIVSLVDIVKDGNGVDALILEYCGGGDLINFIKKNAEEGDGAQGPGQERRVFSVWRDAVRGVAHMHACSVAHLDLKPQNVLLAEAADDATPPRAMVCDFSHSFIAKGGVLVPTAQVGAGKYMAPEVSSGSPYSGPPADVWSLGVLLYTLLTGALPFKPKAGSGDEYDDVKKRGAWEDVPWFSAGLRELLQQLFVPEVATRATIRDLQQTAWWKAHDADGEDAGAAKAGDAPVSAPPAAVATEAVASPRQPPKETGGGGTPKSTGFRDGEGSESDAMSYQEYDPPSEGEGSESGGAAARAHPHRRPTCHSRAPRACGILPLACAGSFEGRTRTRCCGWAGMNACTLPLSSSLLTSSLLTSSLLALYLLPTSTLLLGSTFLLAPCLLPAAC